MKINIIEPKNKPTYPCLVENTDHNKEKYIVWMYSPISGTVVKSDSECFWVGQNSQSWKNIEEEIEAGRSRLLPPGTKLSFTQDGDVELEFEKTLVVSTAHLCSSKECDKLEELATLQNEYCFILNIESIQNYFVSKHVLALLNFAKDQGCTHIKFDCDAECVE
jgi:hypothetical protein